MGALVEIRVIPTAVEFYGWCRLEKVSKSICIYNALYAASRTFRFAGTPRKGSPRRQTRGATVELCRDTSACRQVLSGAQNTSGGPAAIGTECSTHAVTKTVLDNLK